MLRWQSGHVADCKSEEGLGSIPPRNSTLNSSINKFDKIGKFKCLLQ